MNEKLIPCPEHDLELNWKWQEMISFCDDGKTVILIGYRLVLTVQEFKIVKLLFDDPRGTDADEIIEKCFKNKDVAQGNVAVHVHNINQKAMPITGRRLVVGDRGLGYKINENI